MNGQDGIYMPDECVCGDPMGLMICRVHERYYSSSGADCRTVWLVLKGLALLFGLEKGRPMNLNEMRDEAYATSKSKGWYERGRRDIPTLLCLVHSEVSEALEAWRISGDEGISADAKKAASEKQLAIANGFKPEGVAAELADVIIRIGDLCGAYGIDLDAAVKAKMAYNKLREYRHGGKHV